MQIPFLDLKRQYKEIEDEVTASIGGVLRSGAYIVGSEVEAFEQEWARFVVSTARLASEAAPTH